MPTTTIKVFAMQICAVIFSAFDPKWIKAKPAAETNERLGHTSHKITVRVSHLHHTHHPKPLGFRR